ISIDQLSPEVQLSAQQTESIRFHLNQAMPALQEARKLYRMRNGRYTINWLPLPWATNLDPVMKSNSISTLLSYDSALLGQKQHVGEACLRIEAIINVGRSKGCEL